MQDDNQQIATREEAKSKEVAKEYTFEQAKDVAVGLAGMNSSLEHIVEKFRKDTLPQFINRDLSKDNGTEGLTDTGKALVDGYKKIAIGFELETHLALADAVSDKYKALAVDFCNKLIEEYNCTTPSEKALAEIITGSYIRYFTLSQKLNNAISGNSTTALLNAFIAVVSKELDKATRSYITALQTLKQIKNPVIELNVKATTAFIAQNQQVNVDKAEPVEKEEINESK